MLISQIKRLTQSLTNIILQSDNKRIGKENTSLEATRDEKPFSESHREPDLAFLATTVALNLLETLLGKVITLPILGFAKLLGEHSENSLCTHNTSTLASQKGIFEVELQFLK